MRLGLVTPRYGAEIAGGPEHVCRLLAERLASRHDVEVLTTCASSASTWANAYAEGADRLRGVLVRRFAISGARDEQALAQLTRRLEEGRHSKADELEWVRKTGTVSAGLIEFLKRSHRNFDALIFFSYRHGTTIHGLPIAPDRSILFPFVSIDPMLRVNLLQQTLGLARAAAYCSHAERRVVRLYAHTPPQDEEIIGTGIEPPAEQTYPRLQQDARDVAVDPDAGDLESDTDDPTPHLTGRGILFKRRHRLYGPFVLYGGRVESNNGCEELIEYFDSYRAQNGDTSLVMMGIKMMKVPAEPWLRLAGVLPERERMIAFAAADLTAVPDPDDLVAQQVLESFAVGTPVLANARNTAAVDHCRRGGGGLYYGNREEFVDALRRLMSDDRLRASLGRSGRRYVQQQFRWDLVLGRFERLLTRVRGR